MEALTEIPFRERVSAPVDETCRAVGLGRTTIYRLMDEGKITSTTIGRRRLIFVASVLALLEGPQRERAA